MHTSRRFTWVLALLLVLPACKQSAPTNVAPAVDLAATVDGTLVDAWVPFFPPQACVGVKPAADKWLQPQDAALEAFLVEENDIAASSDAMGEGSEQPSPDVEFTTQDASVEVQSAAPIPPVSPLPPDSEGGEVSQDLQAEAEPGTSCEDAPATCVGAPMPMWELFDFQPRSCGFEATYGLDIYEGHVTVVTLLAAW